MSRMKRSERPCAIAEVLKALMTEHDVSLREVARVGGVSPSVVSSWLKGTAPTNFAAVAAIAERFSTTVGFLLTGRPDTAPTGPMTLSEALVSGGEVFSGIARVHIERLVPRRK